MKLRYLLFLFLALPLNAQTIVQKTSNFTNSAVGSSYGIAYTSAPGAGHNLYACLGIDSGNTIAAPTDNSTGGSNTWSLAVSATGTGGSGNASCYYVQNSKSNASAITVTFTWTGSASAAHMDLYEVSGMLTSSPLDKTGSVASSATASVSTSAGTTQNNEFVLAFFYDSPNNRTLTVGSGYSNFMLTQNSSGGDSSAGESKNVTTTGTQTATIGGNSGDVLVQLIATFKASASTPKGFPTIL